MNMLRNKKAQSTLEYAILIAVIVAGLLAMQLYMKRGYQGRLRSATDDIGEQFTPEAAMVSYTYAQGSDSTENRIEGGQVETVLNGAEMDLNPFGGNFGQMSGGNYQRKIAGTETTAGALADEQMW